MVKIRKFATKFKDFPSIILLYFLFVFVKYTYSDLEKVYLSYLKRTHMFASQGWYNVQSSRSFGLKNNVSEK